MTALDHAFWQILRRREAGRIIRRYGVAKFLRQIKRHVVTGGRDAVTRICEAEPSEAKGVMLEALATALY